MRPRAKLSLIVVSLLTATPSIVARCADLGVSLAGGAYLVLLAVLLVGIVGAAMIEIGPVRWIAAALLAAAGTVVDGFESTSGEPLTYDAFVNLMTSAGMVGDTLVEHSGTISWTLLRALLLLWGLGLAPGSPNPMGGRLTVMAPVGGLVLLTAMLFMRGGDGGRGLPSAFVGSSYYLLYAYEAATEEPAERKPVTLPRTTPEPVAHDIVLIMDESVAGNYLDINHENGVRTALSTSRAGVFVHNFGLAASISNCSVATNLTLRHGGTREAYRSYNRTMPSIFAYAKAAGMRTMLVYAQDGGARIQNRMTEAELEDVDEVVEFLELPTRDRDHAVAALLAKCLDDSEAQFVWVNKVGCHFPVADKYPDDHARYAPALERGHSLDVSDIAVPKHWGDAGERWRLYRNSYRNAILWNVGAFFDRLFAAARLDEALIIYTSDHGQALHERGDRGNTTHCSVDPQIEEGVVPLVVLHGAASNASRWESAARENHDRMSHYRIFPTLLEAMGFELAAVQAVYGETLLSRAPDPFTFNILFNARLGRDPVWRHIPIDEVVGPPTSDYDQR